MYKNFLYDNYMYNKSKIIKIISFSYTAITDNGLVYYFPQNTWAQGV